MRRPIRRFPIAPDDGALRQFHALLSEAKKPFLIVGGGGWSDQARRDLEAFASAHEVPVGVSFRCQDYFDNLHPCYGGHIGIGLDAKIADRIRNSDLVIALGARLGEATTGRLHAVRYSEAKAAAGSRLSRSRRDRPRLFADARRGRKQRGLCGRDQAAGAEASIARRLRQGGACRLSRICRADALARRRAALADRARFERSLAPRHHHLQRRRQLCRLGAPVLALSAISHRTRADLGFDGLWPAGGGRRQAAASRAHGHRVRRRRLLPDDRAGVHDRGRKPAAADRDRLQQRHVRHHPDASGARPIPAASPAPISPTPTSRRLRAPAAASAPMSSGPKTLRALSTMPWQADFRPSSSFRSARKP